MKLPTKKKERTKKKKLAHYSNELEQNYTNTSYKRDKLQMHNIIKFVGRQLDYEYGMRVINTFHFRAIYNKKPTSFGAMPSVICFWTQFWKKASEKI